jgi:aspartate/methionine/tyrosine aminotransferase
MANYSDVFRGTPVECTRYLTKEIGVACIPPETFYAPEHAHIAQGYVRFAFCKSDEMLREVKGRLARLWK